jgi:hypothetical protein
MNLGIVTVIKPGKGDTAFMQCLVESRLIIVLPGGLRGLAPALVPHGTEGMRLRAIGHEQDTAVRVCRQV